jgi:hypothetical protein
MMNFRISAAAAIAVAAASLSLYAVIQGNGWMGAGLGAIVVVAGAGALTRMSTLRATIAATAAVLIASIPLLVGAGWLGLAGGVVLLAITAASATGARLLRGLALLLTYCACLLIYLNDIFASAYSYGNIIPSPASLASLQQPEGLRVRADAHVRRQHLRLSGAALLGRTAAAADVGPPRDGAAGRGAR